jgi:hypothetical protein
MSVYLSPIGNGVSFLLANGLPNNGGFINTYQAGTSTPASTYTTSAGIVQNANPIVLGADGKAPNEIWLTGGQAYKFVITDANSISVGPTLDNVYGINDPILNPSQVILSEWLQYSGTPTFISGTSFSVTGNQVATFEPLRRVKASISTGTLVYGTISTSVYNGSITTVVMTMDSANLDSGLSAVYAGILNSVNPSYPVVIGSAPYVVGGGTGDSITATISSTAIILTDDYQIEVSSPGANTLTTPTFTLTLGSSNTGSFNIVKYNNLPLVAGDIAGAGARLLLRWSVSFNSWVLLNPAFSPIYPFSASNQAKIFTANGSQVIPAGFTVKVTATGGGSGGSISPGAGTGTTVVLNGTTLSAGGAGLGNGSTEPAGGTPGIASGGDLNINGTYGWNSGSSGATPNQTVTPTGFGYGGLGASGNFNWSGSSGATVIKWFPAATTSQTAVITVGAGGGNGGPGIVIMEY